jgi:signal transduction histidine kinase
MPRQTNILVVDNNLARLKAISAGLQGMGHQVTTATTGREAISVFRRQTFAIVLVAIKLPDVSVREVLETAQELNPEAAVIVITSQANIEAAVNAVGEGAYAYVVKPRAMVELKTMINNALREQELSIRNRKLVESLQRSNSSLEDANRALAKASRAKSDFLAKMSHELRTPLNVVIGFAELMLDEVPGKVNEEQRQCLDDIMTSGRHLLGLINEVLDLSKVEAGKVELRLQNIALSEVVESVTSAMMAVISQRRQNLDVDLDQGLPLVQADEARLRQVFFNLLSNASKFTPDGGEIKIEAARRNGWCEVSVRDNGIGIKSDDLKQIFEPFFQGDEVIDREGKGTGLGLALVKELIEMHGGRIWVESEYGKGSTFTFILPVVASNKLLRTGAEKGTDCRG